MTALASEVIADILVLLEKEVRTVVKTPMTEWDERPCKRCKVNKPADDYYMRSPNSAGVKKRNIVCKECVLLEAKARKLRGG